MHTRFLIGLVVVAMPVMYFSWAGLPWGKKVDYNADVKPILNKHCMGCHGGVKKAGDVSFLFEHEMLEPGKSGKIPVVRGDADASEMIRRILTDDPDEKMPKNGTPLNDKEIGILKQWINEGAKWETHWAYKKIERPDVPSLNSFSNLFGLLNTGDKGWAKNEIDHFIAKKLKQEGLKTSPEADRATLLRRVSLDITGLPPTEKEVQDFEKDQSPDAYEKVVDRLLKSPAYGEKWTSMWMDLARYADTKGYESDGSRTMWRYRDYVVKSFNEDKPFDRFTIEQIAGDRLPNATLDQKIATGFNRNHRGNSEGGIVPEEYLAEYAVDRLETMSQEQVARMVASDPQWRALNDAVPGVTAEDVALGIDPKGLAKAIRGVVGTAPIADREVLREVTAPSLVIGLEGDTVHPASVAREMAELLPNAELGHIPWRGKPFERYAAASVRKRARLDWPEWAQRVNVYLQVVERLFSPKLIIIGGGVSKKAEKFIGRIGVVTPLVAAELCNTAGIVGAALLASEAHES